MIVDLCHAQQGKYAAAFECWRQALTALRAAGRSSDETTTLHNLGRAYYEDHRSSPLRP